MFKNDHLLYDSDSVFSHFCYQFESVTVVHDRKVGSAYQEILNWKSKRLNWNQIDYAGNNFVKISMTVIKEILQKYNLNTNNTYLLNNLV